MKIKKKKITYSEFNNMYFFKKLKKIKIKKKEVHNSYINNYYILYDDLSDIIDYKKKIYVKKKNKK
jgi:hypothetical protein